MYYKIGDVSKILGISPDIMRYYEKKGIVKPHKDENNDYRYYEVWDINFLIECLWFKQFGFGMKDIAKIISKSSYDELQDTLTHKEQELQESITHQQMLLDCLQTHNDHLEDCQKCLSKFDIQSSPYVIRYINRYNFLYDDSPEIQELGRQWLDYFPFINRCFSVKLDVLMSHGSDFEWGFSMPVEYASKLNVDIRPPIEHVPSCRCLHTVVRQPGKYGFSTKLLDPMLDYARENSLDICGDARGRLLCSVREDDVMTGYFEAWIPIKSESISQ